jgi:hypothetical protein
MLKESQLADRSELRPKIIDRMKELVLPKKIERSPRPSIDELEKLLRQEEPPNVKINPDGTVTEYQPQTTTVEKVADTILDLLAAELGHAPTLGSRLIKPTRLLPRRDALTPRTRQPACHTVSRCA